MPAENAFKPPLYILKRKKDRWKKKMLNAKLIMLFCYNSTFEQKQFIIAAVNLEPVVHWFRYRCDSSVWSAVDRTKNRSKQMQQNNKINQQSHRRACTLRIEHWEQMAVSAKE